MQLGQTVLNVQGVITDRSFSDSYHNDDATDLLKKTGRDKYRLFGLNLRGKVNLDSTEEQK